MTSFLSSSPSRLHSSGMDIEVLRSRLRKAPFDFLSAVSSSTLHDFDKEWHSLCADVVDASHVLTLSEQDLSLAHSTATLLASVSELLSESESEAAKRTTSLMDEVEDVFAQLTLSDVDDIPYRRCSRSTLGSLPTYIPAAYSWISQNLHNPYPSSEVKGRISRDAGRPLRIITDWFKDVRRHIGWVAMCKSHFHGSRALTIQAAKDVYLRVDLVSKLSSSSDVVSGFETIRNRLRNMYPMVDDSGDLSDSTDDSFCPPRLASRRSHSDESPYATTRSSSSTPSLVFSTDDEDNHSLASFTLNDASPVSLGKRKKVAEEDESRQLKRNRSEFISVPDELVKNIGVTVAMSKPDISLDPSSSHMPIRKRRLSVTAVEWEDVTPLSSSSTRCDVPPPLRVLKRRLSVSDSQPTAKRPCLPPTVGPRKQAVSTPIPIAHQTSPDIDDWFRTFELPDTSLSVELFSNWDVTIENDVFPYDSLCDGSFQSDSPYPLNMTPLSDTYQSFTDLGVSLAVDPSVLDISSAFTESPVPTSTPPEPILATASPAFDLLDAFLSTVNAESAESRSTQSSLSPCVELSLDNRIDIFGDLVDP